MKFNSEVYLRQADTQELRAELSKGSYRVLHICWLAPVLALPLYLLHLKMPEFPLVKAAIGIFFILTLWTFLLLRRKILELIAARVEKERILAYVEAKRRQLEEANVSLQKAQLAAESANKAKSQFLAKVSHELRTPLNAILGMNDIAMEITKNEEVVECLKEVKFAATEFMDLINEVLDISKIESGKIEVLYETFSHSKLIQHIISLVEVLSHGKDIHFQTNMDEEIPEYLSGDVVKIRQVLVNLLGNAVKYSPRNAQVELTVRQEVDPNDANKILVKYIIKDTGVGINKYLKANLAKSILGRENLADAFGSTGGGLGLAISSHLISLMGGELDFSSEEGRGSEFYFTISYSKSDQQKITTLSEGELLDAGAESSFSDQVKVLVAEDNLINKKVIEHILRTHGIDYLEFAKDGAEAVSKFKSGNFDLILMDCQMPVMDGYAAAKAIRENEAENADQLRVPIIAVTAQAMVGDKERCLNAGMTDVVTKPIDKKHLLSIIRKYAEQSSDSSSDGQEPQLPLQ